MTTNSQIRPFAGDVVDRMPATSPAFTSTTVKQRVSTGLVYPPRAVQGTYAHRHFKLDGDGFEEHSHSIGRRWHEHLAFRLGPVLLSWVDHDTSAKPTYEPDPDDHPDLAWILVAAVVTVAALALLWFASGASHIA